MQILSKSVLAVSVVGILVSYQNCSDVTDGSGHIKTLTKTTDEVVLVHEPHDVQHVKIFPNSFDPDYILLDFETQTVTINGSLDISEAEVDWPTLTSLASSHRLCKGGTEITFNFYDTEEDMPPRPMALSLMIPTAFEVSMKSSVSNETENLWDIDFYYYSVSLDLLVSEDTQPYIASYSERMHFCDHERNNEFQSELHRISYGIEPVRP